MSNLRALLTIFLLPLSTYASGTVPCVNTSLTIQSEVEDALKVINAARKRVLRGEQANGLTGDNLPAAESMPDLVWNCTLEAAAKSDLEENCKKVQPKPAMLNGTSYFRRSDSSAISLPRIMEFYLSAIEYTSLEKVDPNVTYNNEKDLAVYVNLIRSTATSIGCARNYCTGDHVNTAYTTLCITDQSGVTTGGVVYDLAPNGESIVILESQACPDNPYMTNLVRSAFLTRHNSQRSLLAMGIVQNGNTGKMCRNATQMPRLVYDCALEKSAYDRASQCQNFKSEDTTNLRENSHNYTTRLTRTYVQAAKSTTMLWWSEIRKSSGITQPMNIFYTHLGISRFAKIASDLTTKIGCSIVNCKNISMVNIVCHYETTLAHAKRLYAMGPTCKKCSADCYTGLCPGANDGVKV